MYDKTIPKPFTNIDVIRFDDRSILKIKIEKSLEIVATLKGVVYKRLGKNTKPFYPSEYTSFEPFLDGHQAQPTAQE
ncbi:hypothetical protein [Psychrobacillus sp.]|uniref:hypothetical protein n=1 Tax=Psychrobacillus sp. TaxID=1871623 RepID=UPI0037C76398